MYSWSSHFRRHIWERIFFYFSPKILHERLPQYHLDSRVSGSIIRILWVVEFFILKIVQASSFIFNFFHSIQLHLQFLPQDISWRFISSSDSATCRIWNPSWTGPTSILKPHFRIELLMAGVTLGIFLNLKLHTFIFLQSHHPLGKVSSPKLDFLNHRDYTIHFKKHFNTKTCFDKYLGNWEASEQLG